MTRKSIVASARWAGIEGLLERGLPPAGAAEVLRDDSRGYVCVFRHRGVRLVAKQPRDKDRRTWIRFLSPFRPSHAVRMFRFMERLFETGLPVPEPVAAMERRRFGVVVESWLIYRYVEGHPLSEETASLGVEALRTIHALGFVHGDAHAGNFLVCEGRAVVLDPAPALRLLPAFGMAYDLIRLRNSCPSAGRFLEAESRRPAFRLAEAYDKVLHAWRRLKRTLRAVIGAGR